MSRITGILKKEVPRVWEMAEPFVERVLMQGFEEFSLGDVYQKLVEGNMQLWLLFDKEGGVSGCLITRVVIYPRLRVCELVFGSCDEIDQYLQFHKLVEDWAQSNTVDIIRIYGRKGWEKKMKPLGYRNTSILLTKDLRGFSNENTH